MHRIQIKNDEKGKYIMIMVIIIIIIMIMIMVIMIMIKGCYLSALATVDIPTL